MQCINLLKTCGRIYTADVEIKLILSIKSTIEAEGFIPYIPDTRTRYLLASDWFITNGNWTEWSSIHNEIKWRTEVEIKFLGEISQMLPENC